MAECLERFVSVGISDTDALGQCSLGGPPGNSYFTQSPSPCQREGKHTPEAALTTACRERISTGARGQRKVITAGQRGLVGRKALLGPGAFRAPGPLVFSLCPHPNALKPAGHTGGQCESPTPGTSPGNRTHPETYRRRFQVSLGVGEEAGERSPGWESFTLRTPCPGLGDTVG